MFDIHKVSDKYKILYLKEGVKNKFLTLLLIGLDDQYMDTDLETLNNSSNYYKKNLNQKIKLAFGENFSVKSKGHLDALSEICGVNFIIKNLTSNENKYASKIYGKTLYFVNKGNEYGLVLKSNKKSLKAELTDGTLSAFEKLNLEGGMMGDKTQYGYNANNEYNNNSNTQSSQQPQTPPPSRPQRPSPSLPQTPPPPYTTPYTTPYPPPLSIPPSPPLREQSQLPSPSREQSQSLDDYNANDESNNESNKIDEWKNLCLENCLVNEKSAYYTDIILTEINKEIKQDINEWDVIAEDFGYKDNIFGCIKDMIEYKIKKKEILDSLQYFERNDITQEFNRKFKKYLDETLIPKSERENMKDVWYQKFEKFKQLEKSSSVTENQSSIVNKFNNLLDNDNDLDNDNSLKLKNNVRFNVKINLISSLYELDKGDILASIEEGVDNKGVKRKRQNAINETPNGNDKEQNDFKNQNLSKRRRQKGGAVPYELLDLSKEGQSLGDNNNYINPIKNYTIIDLLERGVDSYHDFGKKLKKDNTNQLNLKKELFEHFNPEKFDDVFHLDLPTDKEKKKEKEKNFLVSLTSLIYESFNTKIIQNLKQNPYKINSNISIPFIPRITKQTSISKDYNPFAQQGWERNSALYYIAGNTILKKNKPPISTSISTSIGIRDENLFDIVKVNSKDIIIFQDSQGASDSIFSFFDNVEMKPGSFYQSFDNYINSLKKNQLDNFIIQLNKITKDLKVNKITKENYDNDDVKYGLYNILKREKLKTINTNIIGTNDNTWNMSNPATALDGAGSNYLVKSDFDDNLKKINIKCYKTIIGNNILRLEEIYNANKQTYPNNFKSPTDYNKLNIYYTGVTDIVTGTSADLISMYRLVYNNNNGKKINVLDNTYDKHFEKICDNTNRKLLTSVPPNPFGLKNVHDIKFEVVLGKFIVNNKEQLWPILLMSHFKLDTIKKNTISKTQNRFNICATSILLDKLTEIDNLTKVMEIIYKLEDKPIDATKILTSLVNSNKMNSNYLYIYKHLMDWRKNTKNTKSKIEPLWTIDKINVVFLRTLYTLKMIGDHGQVKFIKELKKIPYFNNNFEVLFTTGDSLARLYACCHNITNMSAVVTDFPSESYCVSKPKGMVYYPS